MSSTVQIYTPLPTGEDVIALPEPYLEESNVIISTKAHGLADPDSTPWHVLSEGPDYVFTSTGTANLAHAADGATDFKVERITDRVPVVVHQPGVFSSAKANLLERQRQFVDEEQDNALAANLARMVRAPENDTINSLPSAASRALKYLAFSSDGQPVVVPGTEGADTLLRADLATVAGATLVGTHDGVTVEQALAMRGISVSSLAALQGLNPTYHILAYMAVTGRAGWFNLRTGSIPVSDTLSGLYVQSNTAGFYWERDWDQINGQPEWFGAVTDDVSKAATNVSALNAAHILIPRLRLKPGNYFTNATILVATPNHSVIGSGFAGFNYTDGIPGISRIVCTSASATILQVGPTSSPGPNPTYFPQGIHVEDIFVDRSVAPTISSNCAGVLANYVLHATLRNIKSRNSMRGFVLGGMVGSLVDRTYAVRDVAGAGGGTDYWTGYDLDGTYSIGTVGGNASLFVDKANASCNLAGLQASGSKGYYLRGACADLFFRDPESGTCTDGMVIEAGNGASADLRIEHPILDACFRYGIFISGTLASDAINITDPYVAMQGASMGAIDIVNSSGLINILGGQLLMGTSSALGVQLETTTKRVIIRGLLIQANANANAIAVGDIQSCVIEATISNNSGSDSIYNALAAFGSLAACRISLTVDGTHKMAGGIDITTSTDSRCTYDVGGINSANITGGYVNKLWRNGSTALSSTTMVPAYVGTNLVMGCTG